MEEEEEEQHIEGEEGAEDEEDEEDEEQEQDLYATLKVEKTATVQVIRRAYRHLALQHHPDRLPSSAPAKSAETGDSEEVDREAESRTALFQRISRAYAVLSDPDKRARYDRSGSVREAEGAGLGGEGGVDQWKAYMAQHFKTVTKAALDKERAAYQGLFLHHSLSFLLFHQARTLNQNRLACGDGRSAESIRSAQGSNRADHIRHSLCNVRRRRPADPGHPNAHRPTTAPAPSGIQPRTERYQGQRTQAEAGQERGQGSRAACPGPRTLGHLLRRRDRAGPRRAHQRPGRCLPCTDDGLARVKVRPGSQDCLAQETEHPSPRPRRRHALVRPCPTDRRGVRRWFSFPHLCFSRSQQVQALQKKLFGGTAGAGDSRPTKRSKAKTKDRRK